MKKSILCLALAGFLSVTANGYSANAVKIYSNYSVADTSQYQKFNAEAKQEIRDNEKRIECLRDKMNSKTDQAKATLKVKVDSLEAENRRLDNELAHYKEDAKSDWHSFKQKFNVEMDKLKRSFEDVKNDMK